MAKGGKVEIEVELTGVQESEKELAGLTESGAAVGETFTSMGDAVSTFGGEANEALGAVGGAAGDAVGAFMELGGAVKEGGLSFSALAGPIGIVIAGVYALAQAFREYSDEVSGVTQTGEAYLASLTELTSAVEELAAAGVDLNEADVERLHNLSMTAKIKIEDAQLDKERRVNQVKEIERLRLFVEKHESVSSSIEKRTRIALESHNKIFAAGAKERDILTSVQRAKAKIIKLEQENAKVIAESTKKLAEGARDFQIFEEAKEELLERSVDAMKKRAQQELSLEREIETGKITIQEDSLEKQKALEVIAYKKRIDTLADQELKDKDLQARAVESAFQIHQHNIRKLEEADQAKRQERLKKRAQEKQARDAATVAAARKEIMELDKIEQLKIQLSKDGDDQIIALANQRHATQLKLAKDNARKTEQANLEHKLVMRRIEERAENDKRAAQKDQLDFEFSTRQFNAEQIADETTRELELLHLRYEKEIALAQGKEERVKELERRYAIEKTDIQTQSVDAQIAKIGELTTAYAGGFAEAAVGALFFGESFQEATAQILAGLSRQFAVQALGSLAEGTAAIFLKPTAAAGFFKAAAIFSAASLAAGGASAALGGGGGGGGSASASPSGSPQEAPQPDRERAEEVGQVFNINFGGAVIYDTKQAAEQALADRVASVMSTPRRGQYRSAR
jgi:hypothetical protein